MVKSGGRVAPHVLGGATRPPVVTISGKIHSIVVMGIFEGVSDGDYIEVARGSRRTGRQF